LTRAFADDRAKQQQWKSFIQSTGAALPPLAEIMEGLAAFLMPHTARARTHNPESSVGTV
jgi:hypothetical protein